MENKEDKNELLRHMFEKIYVNIIEKGKGRKPAIFKITPIFNLKLIAHEETLV
jgi:hypothetical protein